MAGGREMPAGEMKPGFCRDTPMREVTSGSKTNTPQISLSTRQARTEKYSFCYICHLRADVLTFL